MHARFPQPLAYSHNVGARAICEPIPHMCSKLELSTTTCSNGIIRFNVDGQQFDTSSNTHWKTSSAARMGVAMVMAAAMSSKARTMSGSTYGNNGGSDCGCGCCVTSDDLTKGSTMPFLPEIGRARACSGATGREAWADMWRRPLLLGRRRFLPVLRSHLRLASTRAEGRAS